MTKAEIQQVKLRFGIIGNNEALMRAIDIAIQVAPTDLSVLITGESGVGKESFPQIIHQYSRRKHGQYIAVNCGAIPEGTIDSELFGHEKGAFTGADSAKTGYFDMAKGGTLFLDEIGTMSYEIQSLLLRVLQENTYAPVGGRERTADVRIIAATNEDMQLAIREGRFREDLYHRLNEFEIRQPSLAECPEDILPLAEFFRKKFSDELHKETSGFSTDAERLMLAHSWSGNIRELQNRVRRAVLISKAPVIVASDLNIRKFTSDNVIKVVPDLRPIKDNEAEKQLIIRTLESCNGNKTKAARMLNINPTTLYRKMNKYGIK